MSGSTSDRSAVWIRSQLAAGKSPEQIAHELMSAGWTASAARAATTQSAARPAPTRSARMTIDVSNYPRDGYVTPARSAPADPIYSRPADAAPYPSTARDEARQVALRRLLIGSVSFGLGLAVTLITYALAANGGVYIIAWGAILYGGIDMVRGFAGLL